MVEKHTRGRRGKMALSYGNIFRGREFCMRQISFALLQQFLKWNLTRKTPTISRYKKDMNRACNLRDQNNIKLVSFIKWSYINSTMYLTEQWIIAASPKFYSESSSVIKQKQTPRQSFLTRIHS